MRRLVYALRFHRGPGEEPDEPPTTAGGLELRTLIGAGTIESQLSPLPGDEAVLKLVYRLNNEGTLFFEWGTVTFGRAGASSLSFSSVGAGALLGAPASDGFSHGVVAYTIDSGAGELAGATGAITSNFLVNLQTNELIDVHLGVISLPEEA